MALLWLGPGTLLAAAGKPCCGVVAILAVWVGVVDKRGRVLGVEDHLRVAAELMRYETAPAVKRAQEADGWQ